MCKCCQQKLGDLSNNGPQSLTSLGSEVHLQGFQNLLCGLNKWFNNLFVGKFGTGDLPLVRKVQVPSESKPSSKVASSSPLL
jgi:hypothetical protein